VTITRFFATNKTIYGDRPYTKPPEGFLDIVPKAYRYTRDNFNFDAESRLNDNEFEKNLELYQQLENKPFELEDSPIYDPKRIESINNLEPRDSVPQMEKLRREYYEAKVRELKSQDPNKYGELRSLTEMRDDAVKKAQLSKDEYQRSIQRTDSFTSTAATLTGGFGASFTDPLNIATLPLGASASRGILKTALIEAGINAGVEVVSTPQVAKWQIELGEKYGIGDAVENVGMAAFFGGTAGAALKAGQKGARAGLEAIANNKRFPKPARIAAKYLERDLHIRDNDPFLDSKATGADHIEIINRVKTAFEEGEPVKLRENLDVIDTSRKGIDPEVKKEINKIKNNPLDDDLEIQRQNFILNEIEDMKLEIQNSRIDSGLVETADGGKSRFYDNNYPAWYGDLNLKNKEEFFKIIDKKKGVRYERIKAIADDRLKNGYESNTSGQVMPSEEYLNIFDTQRDRAKMPEITRGTEQVKTTRDIAAMQELDITDQRTTDQQGIRTRQEEDAGEIQTAREVSAVEKYLQEPELVTKQRQASVYKEAQSDATLKTVEQDFQRMVEADPDEEFVVDYEINELGQEVEVRKTGREILEDLKQDENYMQAIQGCAVGKK
jgi:hypothetical protein